MSDLDLVAAVLFGLALLHTFAAKAFERLAHHSPRHGGLWHLLGEIEVVFGFWSFVLIAVMALMVGGGRAIEYAETRQYTEPLFVFTIMVVAASRPVLEGIQTLVTVLARTLARATPVSTAVAEVWICLAVVPLVGSAITEPAAMTLAALMLAGRVFTPAMPERLKYAALGVLFVNVSVGGTLTAFAAPPVLMVAATWGWDTAFMASHFGWKAAIAVLVNATVVTAVMRRHLMVPPGPAPSATAAAAEKPVDAGAVPVPLTVTLIHFVFLGAVVAFAHHPVIFLGLFMLFLGFTQAYAKHQSPLLLKEALLVGFFLAGLVVLGGMQQWWLQPIVSSLAPAALFFGALGLTAITDNAALTYLGSLIGGISDASKYMLVAGAVAGGGLTVIANAPNPAGVTLLKAGFEDQSIGALGLLLGAALPTAVAAAMFWL
jgi:hypothetical protein